MYFSVHHLVRNRFGFGVKVVCAPLLGAHASTCAARPCPVAGPRHPVVTAQVPCDQVLEMLVVWRVAGFFSF